MNLSKYDLFPNKHDPASYVTAVVTGGIDMVSQSIALSKKPNVIIGKQSKFEALTILVDYEPFVCDIHDAIQVFIYCACRNIIRESDLELSY